LRKGVGKVTTSSASNREKGGGEERVVAPIRLIKNQISPAKQKGGVITAAIEKREKRTTISIKTQGKFGKKKKVHGDITSRKFKGGREEKKGRPA